MSVTRERRIAATPQAVWAVVADPQMQERLDGRCRLESATGDWRSATSEFTLVIRGVRLRYRVVEAEPGARWLAEVDRGGRQVAVQTGELGRDGTDTVLRWTVTVSVGPLMRRIQQRFCERELPRWLAAVEREAMATDR